MQKEIPRTCGGVRGTIGLWTQLAEPAAMHDSKEILCNRITGAFANNRINATFGTDGCPAPIARIVVYDPFFDFRWGVDFQAVEAPAHMVFFKFVLVIA